MFWEMQEDDTEDKTRSKGSAGSHEVWSRKPVTGTAWKTSWCGMLLCHLCCRCQVLKIESCGRACSWWSLTSFSPYGFKRAARERISALGFCSSFCRRVRRKESAMGPYVLLLQHLSSILSSEIQHLISDPLHRVRNAFYILGDTIWISDHILFFLPFTKPIHKLNIPTHQPLP